MSEGGLLLLLFLPTLVVHVCPPQLLSLLFLRALSSEESLDLGGRLVLLFVFVPLIGRKISGSAM